MDAFVRLTDLYGHPCYIRTKSLDAWTAMIPAGTEVLIAGHPDTKYIVEETPDVINKLRIEAETDNVHQVDEIEDERGRIAREKLANET